MRFEDSISRVIDDLPPGQKKVGRYILSNMEESSYGTLAKISREVGVSETTIIRFAYTLGFDSFSEMQRALRAQLLGHSTQVEKQQLESPNEYMRILNNEIAILERTGKAFNLKMLDYAAEKLYEADRVVSIAAQTTAPAAQWFAEILGKYRTGVSSVTAVGSRYFTELVDLTNKSVVVAVTFARYSKPTINFLRLAKHRGATTIVITDNKQEVATSYADFSFITESNRDESAVNTISSATAILNMLAAAVYRKNASKARIRLSELEKLYQLSADIVFD